MKPAVHALASVTDGAAAFVNALVFTLTNGANGAAALRRESMP